MSAPTIPIQVPAKDPKKKEEKPETDEKAKPNGDVKEGEDLVCVHCFSSNDVCLTNDLQSDDDMQLKNELEMLTERLRVRVCCECPASRGCERGMFLGTQHRVVQTSSRDTPDADSNLHFVYDLGSEASQVPPPTLPRPAGAIRDMDGLRRQGLSRI